MTQRASTSSASSPALVAGLASLLVLGGLFFATMLLHYRAIDWPYTQFALLRIGVISLAAAGLAQLFVGRLRSVWHAALFGAAVSIAGGVALVAAAA